MGSDEVFSFFQETAGKAVQLKVGADPTGKGARDVTVVPIARRTLAPSTRLDGRQPPQSGRSSATAASPMSICRTRPSHGYTNFNRYYFPQCDKQGAVIDERFNGGGWIADYIVDWLKRPLLLRP